jgi:putative endonuclease
MLMSLDIHKHSYVGYTDNLKKRLMLHNNNKGAKYTRGRQWKVIYYKNYNSKSVAMKEEFKLKKNYKLRKKLKLKFNRSNLEN